MLINTPYVHFYSFARYIPLAVESTARGESKYSKSQQLNRRSYLGVHWQLESYRKMATNFFGSKRVYNWYELQAIHQTVAQQKLIVLFPQVHIKHCCCMHGFVRL
jgi:hypothetical protein